MSSLPFTRTKNRKAKIPPDHFEIEFDRQIECEDVTLAIHEARGHAHSFLKFHHGSHERDVGGKSGVQRLMGHGPGKKRALVAAGFPGIVWRAASCTHVARQVAKDAATSATLEIELTVLAQPPELLRSEEHTSELQSLMRTSYAVFCS